MACNRAKIETAEGTQRCLLSRQKLVQRRTADEVASVYKPFIVVEVRYFSKTDFRPRGQPVSIMPGLCRFVVAGLRPSHFRSTAGLHAARLCRRQPDTRWETFGRNAVRGLRPAHNGGRNAVRGFRPAHNGAHCVAVMWCRNCPSPMNLINKKGPSAINRGAFNIGSGQILVNVAHQDFESSDQTTLRCHRVRTAGRHQNRYHPSVLREAWPELVLRLMHRLLWCRMWLRLPLILTCG